MYLNAPSFNGNTDDVQGIIHSVFCNIIVKVSQIRVDSRSSFTDLDSLRAVKAFNSPKIVCATFFFHA